MFDMGWTEILLIGVIALIVVGPKDLPRMLRTFGQFVGKMRGMARDFQRSMDDAAREADLEELKGIKDTLNDVRAIQNDAAGAIRKGMHNIDKELEEQADLKVEDINEDAPMPAVGKVEKIKPAETAPAAPSNGSGMSSSSAPVDKPDPAVMGKAMPEPGDLVDEAPAPAEPRTASGT